jgi:glutamine synthetase
MQTMSNPLFSLEERLQQLRAQGVHSVLAQFTDILGQARGKLVPLTHVQQLIEEGVQNKSGEYEERYLIRVNKDEYIKVLKHMSEFWKAAKEGRVS